MVLHSYLEVMIFKIERKIIKLHFVNFTICKAWGQSQVAAKRSKQLPTAANGGKIFNKGEKVVTMMSKEGHMRNMKFTSCDVERALGSVSSTLT